MKREIACVAILLFASPAVADDETSSGDKLRILYSNRVTFTPKGEPLVSVEIMSGQKQVTVAAKGLVLQPDGDGGSQVLAGDTWTVELQGGQPAESTEWTAMESVKVGDLTTLQATQEKWKSRGFAPKHVETGTLFAVAGNVMDARQWWIAIAPVPAGQGAAKTKELNAQFGTKGWVYRELVKRPRGTLIAKNGNTVVRNPSAMWFSASSDTISVENVVTGGGGSQLKTGLATRHYSGQVYVAIGKDGGLTVVNLIAAEKMLAGLVPAEMFANAPLEALKAQAIAARTELMQKIGTRHLDDPFLVCSSQHCQVYAGVGHEDPRTTRAVEETRGLVLMQPDNSALVDARYSADCGGISESKDFIWGGEPDPILKSKPDSKKFRVGNFSSANGASEKAVAQFVAESHDDSFCGDATIGQNRHRWRVEIPQTQMTALVNQQFPRVGAVSRIAVLERGASGRARKVQITGTAGSATVEGDLNIRRTFSGLRSSLFVINPTAGTPPQSFVFSGAGFGHGVGMCQTGAIGMAQKRHTYHQILGHYYPTGKVQRLY